MPATSRATEPAAPAAPAPTAAAPAAAPAAVPEPAATPAAAPARPDAMDQIASAAEITELREEIDFIDNEILRLVQRRSEVSQRIGAARLAAGGTKIVYNREMAVLGHYGRLGQEGRDLALILLRLGRGRLGR